MTNQRAVDHACDEAVLDELVALAREDASRGLLQFGGRVGAEQYRLLYRAVRRHVPPGAEVLDWGAGNGHFTYYLSRAGYRATAFSISGAPFESWLPPAGWRSVEGKPEEPTRLPFETASFDAVSSVGVLEHVHEAGGRAEDSLAELTRVLRPGGVFVCCHLPNQWSWIELVARRRAGVHTHDVRYRPREVEALVAGAGLECLELRRYAFLPRNLWSRAPRGVADARATSLLWNGADAVLGKLFPFLCQNYLLVARKPGAGASGAGRA